MALAVLAALMFVSVQPARAAEGLDRLISLDADDAYLPAVLKILAEKGDLNIVTGPGVTAGKITIAEVEHLVEVGQLDPDQIHTPGIFVQRIILNATPEKRIEQRTVRKS